MVAIIHQHNDMGFLQLLTNSYINSSGALKTEVHVDHRVTLTKPP